MSEQQPAENRAPFMPVKPEILSAITANCRIMVSYPRTGSNWLATALNQIINLSNPEKFENYPYLLPDLYCYSASQLPLDQLNCGKLLKTHSWDYLPPSRVIYVTRSLEDIMISYWTFAQRTGQNPENTTIEDFIRSHALNAVEHHRRLLSEISENKHQITVTSYERLKNNMELELIRIAENLEISAPQTAIQAALNATRWENTSPELKNQDGPAFWQGRVGLGNELLQEELLVWLRAQEKKYLSEVSAFFETN